MSGHCARAGAHAGRAGFSQFMFNPQAPLPQLANRTLLLRHSLAAAFKAHRRSLPAAPQSLPLLIDSLQHGFDALLGRAGAREALSAVRDRLFHAAGREADAERCWQESVATAVFAARLAKLLDSAPDPATKPEPVSIAAAACGGLLHLAGEALALRILAHVEVEFRLKMDGASRREWCTGHGVELIELLVHAWPLPPACSACVLGWRRFGEFAAISSESTAVYLGRLFAIELLHPDWCVPGALAESLATIGLPTAALEEVRAQATAVHELLRALA